MAKVGIIGSGGREAALGWSIAKDPDVTDVVYFPGNPGTQGGKGRNIALGCKNNFDIAKIYDAVMLEGIDTVVVGPEGPLALGMVNQFAAKGYKNVFGPTKEAADLEADKFFSYSTIQACRAPQARSKLCTTTEQAIAAIKDIAGPQGIVIKARGLTGGKGVTVCDTAQQALEEITAHAAAYGPHVLIAERLIGPEFSVFGISDGNHVVPIEIAVQDHKRQLDGDKGPNTGGMGAYCPVGIAPRDVVKTIADTMMTPVVQDMQFHKMEYKGFLYAGMIMTADGPKILEFNARFGDPECQPAMMMLKGSIYRPIRAALEGKLDDVKIDLKDGAACCVVMASQGYPAKPVDGFPITGMESAVTVPGVQIFQAGTNINAERKLCSKGGRVLGVTAYDERGITCARNNAYEAAAKLGLDGSSFQYRKDIAWQALAAARGK